MSRENVLLFFFLSFFFDNTGSYRAHFNHVYVCARVQWIRSRRASEAHIIQCSLYKPLEEQGEKILPKTKREKEETLRRRASVLPVMATTVRYAPRTGRYTVYIYIYIYKFHTRACSRRVSVLNDVACLVSEPRCEDPIFKCSSLEYNALEVLLFEDIIMGGNNTRCRGGDEWAAWFSLSSIVTEAARADPLRTAWEVMYGGGVGRRKEVGRREPEREREKERGRNRKK